MNRGSNSSSQIGRTEREEAQSLVTWEWKLLGKLRYSFNESWVHRSQITTLLHRYYSQMILLVAPDEKSFGLVIEYASTCKIYSSVVRLHPSLNFYLTFIKLNSPSCWGKPFLYYLLGIQISCPKPLQFSSIIPRSIVNFRFQSTIYPLWFILISSVCSINNLCFFYRYFFRQNNCTNKILNWTL